MKRSIFTLIFFFCLQSCIFYTKAQTLYSATVNGGEGARGTIERFTPATNTLTVAKSLEGIAANPVRTSLIQASDGKLYGMASRGGSHDAGVIFSFDPETSTYSGLKDFENSLGRNPNGSLVQAIDGKLYGMTPQGGSSDLGVLFSFDPVSSTYTKLHDFNGAQGGRPFYNSLVQAKNGRLYGMTFAGGSNNMGVIFSFDPVSSVYTKLLDFNGSNGAAPEGSLIQASDGKLYGLTSQGGSNNAGVIFSFAPSTSAYARLKDLDFANGSRPRGSFLQASDGKLYATAASGGGSNGDGVIFSFNPSSSVYTIIKKLDNTAAYPSGNLIQASDGKLYGTTPFRYTSFQDGHPGTLFSIDPSSLVFTILRNFENDANGAEPMGSLLQASDNKLYGMTYSAGNSGFGGPGVIFSFDPAASAYTKVKDFGENETGLYFSARLVKAENGMLYGMTREGGSNGVGVIFALDAASHTYTKLKDFEYANGAHPYGALIQASDGKLYGLTYEGGSDSSGVIFSFDPSSLTYVKLKDLNDEDGAHPYGSLVQAGDGKLYGMTSEGGENGDGVIFSFAPSSSTYTKLKDLEDADGKHPYGDLIQASNGKLYGMTWQGGADECEDCDGPGVIFSFDPSTSVYNIVKDFGGADGGNPRGSLIEANDGRLYGMSVNGGSGGYGIIFSLDPSANNYTIVKDLDPVEGAYPYGNLLQASDGKLYGMTTQGGNNGRGTVFSFDPSANAFSKLRDYNGASGAYSYGSAFIEVDDAVENTPPSVSLTTPANSATYLAGGNVYLTAAASDADGTISKVEFYNGSTLLHTVTDTPYTFKWQNVKSGNYTLTAKATDNGGMVSTSAEVHISVVPNKPPTVNIINPANNQTFLKGSTIQLQAAAKDPDGRVTKVEFYNGATLLATERKLPYTFDWKKLPVGNYTVTAKATDNWGAATTSTAVNISVVLNKAPSVSLINPAHEESFTSPATINLEAAALDADGRITKVDFYNGATLLATERKLPYTYQWQNVPSGTYTLTAVAQDNWGAVTTSAPVEITVTSNGIAGGRPAIGGDNTGINGIISLKIVPNPAKSIITLYSQGWQQNSPVTLSILSPSGAVVKTLRYGSMTQAAQLNVSSLVSGVYTIKIMNGDKVMYKRFVKL